MKRYIKWGCGIPAAISGIILLMFSISVCIVLSDKGTGELEYEDRSDVINSAKKIEKLTSIKLPFTC